MTFPQQSGEGRPSLPDHSYSNDLNPAVLAADLANEDPEAMGVEAEPVATEPEETMRTYHHNTTHRNHANADHSSGLNHDNEEEGEEHDPEAYGPSDSNSFNSIDKQKGNGRPPLTREQSRASAMTQSSAAFSTASSKEITFDRGSWSRWLTFKGRTPPPIPKERTVSREYGASLASKISFQWITPLMSVGYQRPLELKDIWLVNPERSADVLANRLKKNFDVQLEQKSGRPLLFAMYNTFKLEFWIGGICQLCVAVIQTLNPFVLRYLIAFAQQAYYSQQPGSNVPKPNIGHGVGLVIAITIMQTLQNMCSNQFMYRGMIVGAQARAAMISLIFDKAMTISARAKAGGQPLPTEGGWESPEWIKQPSSGKPNMFLRMLLPSRKADAGYTPKPGILGDGQGYTNGRIVNLMSTDTYRIDQASGMFHMIWTSPIQIVIVLILLLVNISYSALAGFALFVIMVPALTKSISSLQSRRKAINKVTDQRVSLTQEILQSVRFVKYFGWEMSFLDRLASLRRKEIRSIQFLLAIRNGINAVGMSMPVFASMLAFICYAYTHPGLNPSLIFSSLALFNSLRLPLNILPLVIGQVTDAVSSIYRIQEFVLSEDAHESGDFQTDKYAIEMKGGAFTWERVPSKPDERSDKQIKTDLKKQKKEEKLRAKRISTFSNVTESTEVQDEHKDEKRLSAASSDYSGEQVPFTISSLDLNVGQNELIAVIGSVGSGKSSLLSALAGDMRKTAGELHFGANRAFCPQYAWIQNATVQENILFGKELDHDWYDAVIDACALRPDLEMLPDGDRTEIGERGITVSGGQKQRLNIARAIYFNSEIVLMDDPLSAVDAHVGRHIMDNAICGLLRNKCRILATHQLWVLNRCDRIIWMDNGRIIAIDSYDNLMANNPEFVDLVAKNAQEEKKTKANDSSVEGESSESEEDEKEEHEKDKKRIKKRKGGKKPAGVLMQTEERAQNGVSASVYASYARAAGSILVIPLVLFLVIISQGSTIVTSLWLSWWTSNKFGYSTGVYVAVYAALGVMTALSLFVMAVSLTIFGTNASKVMLQRAVHRVLRAPMSFFDTTPLGRITNRFSKDIDTMDNMLTDSMRFFFITSGMIIAVFILIIAYYYYFAVALAPLLVLFVFSAGYYRASAREVKRHESVLRSDVFAKFSEAVSGISTIRAYGLQNTFAQKLRGSIDNMNSAYYLTFANQRWLSVRLDVIGNLLIFITGILVVTSRFSVDPSTGGLVLSYILTIVQMIQFSVRQLAEVENNMNSVERIHHYGSALEEEAPIHIPNPDVTPEWPQRGEIEFKHVQMRYREGLPLVLKDFSLHIRGGERVGVVGRTGAGKSSIMSTLFRLVELSGGQIDIDGVNIAKVGLGDLRSRLAIIPQDPTLFHGTIRSNLDPFGKYSDLELWRALHAAGLVGQAMPGSQPQAPALPSSSIDSGEEEGDLKERKNGILTTAQSITPTPITPRFPAAAHINDGASTPSSPATPPSGLNEKKDIIHTDTQSITPTPITPAFPAEVSQPQEPQQQQSRLTLDTSVEEEGHNFSLGQRQLMALARALVRNSQIIVCDEATSSVDMATDEAVQNTLNIGFKGRTLLCIAHRLRTIINYDRILVMDQGHVAEWGTPKELWEMNGIFKSMCMRSRISEGDLGMGWKESEVKSE